MTDLFTPLTFGHGPPMKNRFMLAPLTDRQSHADGTLSEDEYRWLTMRARGGFAAVMTCAAHVQAAGRGFPAQLGIFGEEHLEGLGRLARGLREQGSLSVVQLHHAGLRSPGELIEGRPRAPSDDPETGARAMSEAEVEETIEAFVAAAERAERAGFDGVEVHGAHGYLICQFLSGELNRREDRFGGSLENRARVLLEIVSGIRQRCGESFNLGVRLSPERFGLRLAEVREVASQLLREARIDYLDVSLWDVFKEPEEEAFRGRSLMSYFTELERGGVRLGVAGKIARPAHARHCLDEGVDFVLLGRAAILQHDFPLRARAEGDFEPVSLPVTRDHLRRQGLGEAFIDYLGAWKGFVEG